MYAPTTHGDPVTTRDEYGGHVTTVTMYDPTGNYGDVRVTVRTGDPAPRPPRDPARPTWGTVPTARVVVTCLPHHTHWRTPPARVLARLVDQHLAAAGARLRRDGRRYDGQGTVTTWSYAYPLARVADAS